MPKQQSSASNTCKKHALKSTGPRLTRGETKTRSHGCRVKPQPIAPDPLDPLGLAYVLPAELVVILRRLGKNDTTRRALEELKTYVEAGAAERDDYAVRPMLPVWLPYFFSKRIRLLAVALHAITLPLLAEEAPSYVLGAWLKIAHDSDKLGASVASTSSFSHTERGTVDALPFLR
ncbi:hypothetical protein FIBSPDRAFT_927893, partial [Athelia psychrophila]